MSFTSSAVVASVSRSVPVTKGAVDLRRRTARSLVDPADDAVVRDWTSGSPFPRARVRGPSLRAEAACEHAGLHSASGALPEHDGARHSAQRYQPMLRSTQALRGGRRRPVQATCRVSIRIELNSRSSQRSCQAVIARTTGPPGPVAPSMRAKLEPIDSRKR
jgi:hypothetical protein